MKNNIQVYQIQPRNNFFGVIGFITYNDEANVDAELIWHLTNWSCWSKEEEPKVVECDGLTYHPNKNDQGYTNHDICFYDGKKWMCADMCGWSSFDTLDEALAHLKQTNKR